MESDEILDTVRRMSDAEAAAKLIAKLAKLTPRMLVIVLPDSWTTEQAQRLTRCVNRVLEVGEAGLRTIEDALHG